MSAITDEIIAFRDAREWGQFHTVPNLIQSLAIEAGELLETTQWGTPPQFDAVTEELADVLIYAYLLARKLGVSPEAIVRRKLEINAGRYPVEAAKGHATKWTHLPGQLREEGVHP